MDLIKKLRKIWRYLGPGLITGAVDDDPRIDEADAANVQDALVECGADAARFNAPDSADFNAMS